MTQEEKAIYFYSRNDFLYCLQILKDKASKSKNFPLLEKMPFTEAVQLKNEIKKSISCFNLILQENRASGLSTILGLFLACDLYFNNEEKRNIFVITNDKHIINFTNEFLKYLQIVYGNEEIKINSINEKRNNIFHSFVSGNLQIFFTRENAYTIQNLTSLNKSSRLEIYYDNVKVTNERKLESVLSVFYNDNFSCNIFYSSTLPEIRIKYEPNIIKYKHQTIQLLSI